MKTFDFRRTSPERPLTPMLAPGPGRASIFAGTSTAAWYPERCRCDACNAHDSQIARDRRISEQRHRDHWNRQNNYLEPTIARLDRLIATLKKHAA